jgi:hypothetical protein
VRRESLVDVVRCKNDMRDVLSEDQVDDVTALSPPVDSD